MKTPGPWFEKLTAVIILGTALAPVHFDQAATIVGPYVADGKRLKIWREHTRIPTAVTITRLGDGENRDYLLRECRFIEGKH